MPESPSARPDGAPGTRVACTQGRHPRPQQRLRCHGTHAGRGIVTTALQPVDNSTTTPGRTSSTSSRRSASSRSSAPSCSRSRPRPVRGCSTTGSPRSSPRRLGVDTAQLPQPLHAQRRRLLVPRRPTAGARTPTRGCAAILREATFAPPPALRQLAEITDFDLFVTTTFDSLLEQAINAERFGGAQSTEVDRATRPTASPTFRAEREQLQRARRLPPARPAVRLADLRDLRRGHARVRLRAAERAPHAGEALPRARAQPPAAHRQQVLQLAGAAVPAHGQAPAAVRSARRGRSAGRRPLGAATSG